MRLENFLPAFFVVTLLSGCGSTPVGPNATSDGQTITVKDPEGKMTAVAGAKQEYPSDIPCSQYPGSEIVMVAQMNESKAGEVKKSATLKTSDAVEKITQFYKDQLTSAGWTIDNVIDTNGIANIHAKKDAQEINISVVGNATEGNVISIAVI